jgi:hypothetical protein
MIYLDKHEFLRAVGDFVKIRLPDPDSHKKTAVFTVGDSLRGHSLSVNEFGWAHNFNGRNLEKRTHIASPLANLQAAAVFFGV